MGCYVLLRQLARNKLPATLTRSVSEGRMNPSLTLRVGILFSVSCLTVHRHNHGGRTELEDYGMVRL